MNLLAKLLLGNGKLKPKLRRALESEGLVLLEEGLPGSVRYHRFKAPGRRFHRKVTGERIGLAVSEERFVVYRCSGRVELATRRSRIRASGWSRCRFDRGEDAKRREHRRATAGSTRSMKREGARGAPAPSSCGQKYGRTTAPYGGSAVVQARLGS